MPEVKTVKGVEIHVNRDGQFYAQVGLTKLTAYTLTALVNQITKAVSKTRIRVAVPVTQLGWSYNVTSTVTGHKTWQAGTGVRHLTLTGIHANGNLLAKCDLTGELLQLNRGYYGRGEYVRRLTKEEEEIYLQLHRAHRAAERRLRAFEEKVALKQQLGELVKAAISEKVDDPKEAPEDPGEGDPR